ncbi:hypothetical protein SISSUDRAFT_1054231, partial [Sistotremastrum suecicum HHB10207 ss-3]
MKNDRVDPVVVVLCMPVSAVYPFILWCRMCVPVGGVYVYGLPFFEKSQSIHVLFPFPIPCFSKEHHHISTSLMVDYTLPFSHPTYRRPPSFLLTDLSLGLSPLSLRLPTYWPPLFIYRLHLHPVRPSLLILSLGISIFLTRSSCCLL